MICKNLTVSRRSNRDIHKVVKVCCSTTATRGRRVLAQRTDILLRPEAEHRLDVIYTTRAVVRRYFRVASISLEQGREELNVKRAEKTQDMSKFSSWTFKPQLKVLGPKYGKNLGEIRQLLSELDGTAAHAELEQNGSLVLDASFGQLILTEEDLLIEPLKVEGYVEVSDMKYAVALDIRLTPELIEEGNVREIISKIQTMRKDSDFNVMDHIAITAKGSQVVLDVMARNKDAIMHDVLGTSITFTEPEGVVKDWNINGEPVTFGVKVVD